MAKTAITATKIDLIPWDGTSGNDTFTGTDSADIAYGYGGNDVMSGNGGDDLLFGGAGSDAVYGGTGNDVLWGDSASDPYLKKISLDGDDLLNGGAGDDTIYGEGGSDKIDGGGGLDKLFGGAGNDNLANGAQLFGGDGDDDLSGANLQYGGGGDDVLRATMPGSTLSGDGGNDTILMGGFGSQMAVVYGGDGLDRILAAAPGPMGTVGATVFGDGGDDFISLYSGFAHGGDGNDTLEMRISLVPGTIDGGAGHDLVHAVQGTIIDTGAGKDRTELLAGFAPGADLEGGNWRDFDAAEDKIGVVGYGYTNYGDFIDSAAVSISQSGTSVIVAIAGQASLTLHNTALSDLHEGNFYFG